MFIDNLIVLSGTDGTYVGEVEQTHNLKVVKLRKLDLVSACVSHAHYQSMFVSLSLDLRKIQIFTLLSKSQTIAKRSSNPLTN